MRNLKECELSGSQCPMSAGAWSCMACGLSVSACIRLVPGSRKRWKSLTLQRPCLTAADSFPNRCSSIAYISSAAHSEDNDGALLDDNIWGTDVVHSVGDVLMLVPPDVQHLYQPHFTIVDISQSLNLPDGVCLYEYKPRLLYIRSVLVLCIAETASVLNWSLEIPFMPLTYSWTSSQLIDNT